MDKKIAEQINDTLIGCAGKLNESAILVRAECTEEEIEAFLKPVSKIMAVMFDMLDEIYEDYPELKPDEIG